MPISKAEPFTINLAVNLTVPAIFFLERILQLVFTKFFKNTLERLKAVYKLQESNAVLNAKVKDLKYFIIRNSLYINKILKDRALYVYLYRLLNYQHVAKPGMLVFLIPYPTS